MKRVVPENPNDALYAEGGRRGDTWSPEVAILVALTASCLATATYAFPEAKVETG